MADLIYMATASLGGYVADDQHQRGVAGAQVGGVLHRRRDRLKSSSRPAKNSSQHGRRR
jgi:hypothetical protein